MNISPRKYITTKSLFTVSLLVVCLIVPGVWLFGVPNHQSIYENSMLSTTILSMVFFIFLSYGLYNGIKLKDDLGKITDKIKYRDIPDLTPGNSVHMFDVGDGIGGIIGGIIVWLIVTVVIILFILVFSWVFWVLLIAIIAMLYWIFFRALRLVFKNSNKCKGKLVMSIGYAVFYTCLYNFWIYGIILTSHYLIK